MIRGIEIVECTLRDGGYAVNHQFTARDTYVICRALEDAGFNRLEIGHGCGLGASGIVHGVAAATDAQYLQAASEALSTAKFGTFFIPGVGTREDLRAARQYGMHFVRVGTNVTESEQSESFIKFAKDLGFEVSYNAMKSYAVSPAEFVDRSARTVEWGADIVAVVDSAGGMLPSEVSDYISRLKLAVGVPLGFHGHNNLMLAHGNCLAAIEAGATLVDTTMAGVGRSAGNAASEILVLVLERMGIPTGVDIHKAFGIADNLIRPLVGFPFGVPSIDGTMGFAQFHSGYFKHVDKAANRWGVDPHSIIIEVSKLDRVAPSESLFMEVAANLANTCAAKKAA